MDILENRLRPAYLKLKDKYTFLKFKGIDIKNIKLASKKTLFIQRSKPSSSKIFTSNRIQDKKYFNRLIKDIHCIL